jgi:phosphatidylserine synthase
MILQLKDPANAITATGIVLSVIGIHAAMIGHPQWGVAVVLQVNGNSLLALLCASVLVLAVLHVTRMPVPRTSGAMYAVVALFAVTSSAVLAIRDVS